MLIKHNGRSVEKYFMDYSGLAKKLGSDWARTIKKRMGELNASPSFQTYLQLGLGNPHPLHGSLKGCYAVSVSANVRLIIKPELGDNNTAALSKCTEVVIIGVCDYHGEKENWIIP